MIGKFLVFEKANIKCFNNYPTPYVVQSKKKKKQSLSHTSNVKDSINLISYTKLFIEKKKKRYFKPF